MRIYILIVFSAFNMIFSSCEKDKPTPGERVDVAIDILLQNSVGEDLLNSQTNNNLLNSDIKVYQIVNGTETELYNSDLDCPRNFCIIDDGKNKVFRLFPIEKIEAQRASLLIKWNSLRSDKIIANIVSNQNGNNSNTFCDSVWVNGILKFPNSEFAPARKFIHFI